MSCHQPRYSSLAQLSSRQCSEITLAITEPFRVDELLTHGIDELVRGTNGSVADACNCGYLLGRLWLTHEMRGGVDTSCSDGQRRATGKRADFVSLLRDILRDSSDPEVEAELVAEAVAERFRINRLCSNVIVLGVDQFLDVQVSKAFKYSLPTDKDLPPASSAMTFFFLFSESKNFSRALKILPISALETLVKANISLKVRGTPNWRQAMKRQPAIIVSCDLPLKALASSTFLNRCFA